MVQSIWELTLQGFRNLSGSLSVKRWPLVVCGPNGSGKTSLLEAIYTLSNGRSFRTRIPGRLIHFRHEEARVTLHRIQEGDVLRLLIKNKVQLFYQNKPVPVNKMRRILPVIYLGGKIWEFVPYQPVWRRNLMDQSLQLILPSYYALLIKYRRTLKQRNYFLQSDSTDSMNEDETWFHALINSARDIWQARSYLIEQIQKFHFPYWRRMFPFLKISMALKPGGLSSEEWKVVMEEEDSALIRSALVNVIEREKEKKTSLIGPHRDDLMVETNHGPFWEVASAGQIRAFLISWAMALNDMVNRLHRSKVVILIDDFDAELDRRRTSEWLKILRDKEVILTSHRQGWLKREREYQAVRIEEGKFRDVRM